MAETTPQTFPIKTIALLLLMSERRVQQLSREGVIPKGARGRYELVGAVQGYIRFMRERMASIEGASDPDRIDFYAEKARKTKADADIAEMNAARMRGNLVDAAEVAEAMEMILGEVRKKLLNSVPSRIAARAKTEKSEARIKAAVLDEVRAALQDLSGLDPADLVERDG